MISEYLPRGNAHSDLQGLIKDSCKLSQGKALDVYDRLQFKGKKAGLLSFNGIPYGTFIKDKPL